MPVYLVHGFRWPREGFDGIRVHSILNNLDDCSAEYIQNANSRAELLRSFRKAFPDIMKELDHSDPENDEYTHPGLVGSRAGGRRLEFVEQYNPEDVEGPHAVSQPYAFIGDKVVVIAASPGMGLNGPSIGQTGVSAQQRVPTQPESPTASQKQPSGAATLPVSRSQPYTSPAETMALSVNVEEVIAHGPGLTNKAWEALADLRDKIAEGEKIGWWVVYNGDPERSFDDVDDDEEDDAYDDEEMEDVEEEEQQGAGVATATSPTSPATVVSRGHRPTGSDDAPIPASTAMGTYPISTAPVAPMLAQAQQIATQPRYQPQTYHQQYHQQRQQQQGSSSGLTALPVRPFPPTAPGTRPGIQPTTGPPVSETKGKEREKDVPEDPAKLKEMAKSQGLRKKFFGRRI